MPDSIRASRVIIATLALIVLAAFPEWRQVLASVGGYATPDEQRSAENFALTEFYRATNGDHWTNNSGWMGEPGTQCSWYGISCDGNGFVTSISFPIKFENNMIVGNNLTGVLPAEIELLSQLQTLNLQNNQIGGSLPPSIGNLSKLESLHLSNNQLTGDVPAGLYELPLLTSLLLLGNQLLVPLADPDEREALIAFYNALDGESWTNSTGWLGNSGTECNWYGITCSPDAYVTEIRLATVVDSNWVGNNLSGILPEQIGAFQKLKNLTLPNNNIQGTLPSAIGNLADLEGLHLSGNPLTGTLPDELWGLSKLRQLYLTNNQFEGTLSPQIGQLTQLRNLGLWSNSFEGALPATLGNLAELTQLALGDNMFTGSIPSEIFGLTSLTTLGLYSNQLTGGISSDIGLLTNLTGIRLENNNLTGSIPDSIGNLQNLQSILLFNNQLTGTLPGSLTQLNKLTTLSVSNNQLTGEVPSGIYEMPLLTNLYLAGNQFSVPLADPDERSALIAFYGALDGDNWRNNAGWLGESGTECQWYGVTCDNQNYVTSINFSMTTENNVTTGNNLTGVLPPEIGDFTRLGTLSLASNSITGAIPEQIGELANLVSLNLRENSIGGSLPSALTNLTKLAVLQIDNNEIAGTLPADLGSMVNLQYLLVQDNQLSGNIPASISQLSKLQLLMLMNNELTGEIPESIGQLAALRQLYLLNNSLTGEIPASLGNLVTLTTLSLGSNQLSGAIPQELSNLTELTSLTLERNQFVGEVPNWIWSLTNLEYLNLYANGFTGSIPETIGNLTNLQVLNLDSNQITGTIPSELVTLPDLRTLLVGNNSLTGLLPEGLLEKESLAYFYYFGNYIAHDPISQGQRDALIAFYNATNGESWTENRQWLSEPGTECNWFGVSCDPQLQVTGIRLPDNNLSGSIPAILSDLESVAYVNLADNNLTGTVPDIFGQEVVLLLDGNNFDEDPIDPAPKQIVSLQGDPIFFLSATNTLSIEYTTSDENAALTGLGIRVHIDSSTIDVAEFKNVLSSSLLAVDTTWSQDSDDFDNNATTDLFATVAWSDVSGNWPGSLPITLFDLELTALDGVTTDDQIQVGFSSPSNTPGYGLELPQISLTPVDVTLDVDGNGKVEALTDALMIIRNLFGFSGSALIDRAVATDATFKTSEQTQIRLAALNSVLDVDGNGKVDALTDGLLIMRYAFGFRGEVLIGNATASDAIRMESGQIESYLSGLMN